MNTTASKSIAKIHAGTLTALHPWINKRIRIGVAKLTPLDRAAVQRDLQVLLDLAPKYEYEAAKVDARAHAAYFKYFELMPEIIVEIDSDGNAYIGDIAVPIDSANLSQILDLKAAWAIEREARLAAEASVKTLQERGEHLLRSIDAANDSENRMSVSACLELFKKYWKPKKAGATEYYQHLIKSRVTAIADAIGAGTRFGSVTQADVEAAVAKVSTKSEATKSHFSASAKLFFAFLQLPEAQNGCGFKRNPAKALRYLSPKQLQKKRRLRGEVVVAENVEPTLKAITETKWRALYGVLCYAGLRNSEAALLTWDCIDFEKKQVHVRPVEGLKDTLKNDISPRVLKPFVELWPILKTWKTESTDAYLFCRRNGKSYFRLAGKEAGRLNHFSRDLKRALERSGVDSAEAKSPNRKARRYWESRMRASGLAHLIPVWGGHGDAVGLDNYTNSQAVSDRVDHAAVG